jgi:hypothetical protein
MASIQRRAHQCWLNWPRWLRDLMPLLVRIGTDGAGRSENRLRCDERLREKEFPAEKELAEEDEFLRENEFLREDEPLCEGML